MARTRSRSTSGRSSFADTAHAQEPPAPRSSRSRCLPLRQKFPSGLLNPLLYLAFVGLVSLVEDLMDRRSFLTALFGVAGAAALASAVRPINAVAGVPNVGNGILDELDAPDNTEPFDDEGTEAELEPVSHRRGHRRHERYERRYYRRHHRRRVWRRVCRRYWYHGRVRTRCYRQRVWL